jgi:hypothetical protein
VTFHLNVTFILVKNINGSMKVSDILNIGWGNCEIVEYEYEKDKSNVDSEEQQLIGITIKKNGKIYEIRTKENGELDIVEV